jgi:serine/threonine protein kinase
MRMAELTTWTNGSLVGPYVLLESIGEGGMGEVWKARDTRLDRVVAVKRLKNDHGDRFEQEARTIAALNHPHICQIFDIGSDYLVLEYIDGQALRGPRSPAESVHLAIQIASALEEAHACGILHRDLKPANIMVTAKGVAKLLDFGLAKLITPAAPDGTTTTEGTILGTVAYMAPEQAEGKRLDERSDIFSFGVVLYELLSGRRAFQADSSISTLAAILYKQPAPLHGPAPLPDIVNRCLAKMPTERFQTMVEVREALEKSQQQALRPAFDSIELDRLESQLSRSVGPIAKTLVGKAAARHSSFEALCQELAQHIPGEAARFDFMRALGRRSEAAQPLPNEPESRRTGSRPGGSPSAGSPSTPFDERTLSAARTALAVYLGPMASMAVERAARNANTTEALKAALAAHILDEGERRTFLKSF